MNDASNVQRCKLCMKRPASSREHIPPRATSNIGEVEIIFIDAKSPTNQIKYKTIHSTNGFWVPALCEKCNNKTGSRYGEAYKHFVLQFSEAVGFEESTEYVRVRLRNIYPLRILKQMFSMFLCATPFQPAPEWKDIREFVLKRDKPLPSNAPFVYLYLNASKIGRIVPCCGIWDLFTRKTLVVSEITWPSVGIIFSFQDDEQLAKMANITEWGQFGFNDKISVTLTLPRLQVCTPYPLDFRTTIEAMIGQPPSHLAYLFHVPFKSESPVNLGAIIRKSERDTVDQQDG